MDLDVVKEITNSSNVIVTWSMSIIAASLLAILSTSYLKPVGKWSKLMYLIYIPGWIYLAIDINLGNIISRRQIMAIMESEKIPSILNKMNEEFTSQISAFRCGLICFGIWLLLFLLWWILQDFVLKSK